MSCQSLTAARAFDADKEMPHCTTFHRSVRFSSESRSSPRASCHESEKRDTLGSISLLALSVSPQSQTVMSQSAPPPRTYLDDDEPPPPPPASSASCRFPKLEECAHFHYERVSLGGLRVQTARCHQEEHCATHSGDCAYSEGWVCLKVRSHVSAEAGAGAGAVGTTGATGAGAAGERWGGGGDTREWSLTRSAQNLLQLDDMLHRCIYDRKVSGLPDLSATITEALIEDREAYISLISDYMHHLSIIADDSINCGPVLNWLQMDNKGHKLLVANEDSSSINTPAVAAAYSVRKYVSQARDEISFEVGDMISIIDMPGPQESVWWRGKRGFRVGFFPHHCVAVIGDKVPRNMTHPPPIVGSVAVTGMKPVLRKHGKLISLFRSFILSRPSRRSLKQQGILRERVFGCDLGEHLLNCGHEVPLVLVECARVIEERGAVDGIYRLSGGSGLTQRLRAAFDEGKAPDLSAPPVVRDPHALASLLKMYFRELPNPLCTYQLYNVFVSAVSAGSAGSQRLADMRAAVAKLPPPHYRTLVYLMRHLRRVSLLGAQTGMTARNMAIVWAPNLLRAPHAHHALHGIAQQAVVTEFLICYAEELFSSEPGSGMDSSEPGPGAEAEQGSEGSGVDSGPARPRRPKSLPLSAPAKLLSLEEARRRGRSPAQAHAMTSPQLPAPSGAIAAAAGSQLKPSGTLKPKYIEVGSGPNNLPQYHTVLDLPVPGAKRGLKRSPSGWRTLFSRSKQHRAPRAPPRPDRPSLPRDPRDPCDPLPQPVPMEVLRPVKSCESLQSEGDTVAPLTDRAVAARHHTRSSSCDSYFEPWQTELAQMRLRLSPQERDNNMFSEEDDTALALANNLGESLCSTPIASEACSVEPSPLRLLKVDVHAANESVERKRSAIEEELASIGYIDGGESPRCKLSDRHAHLSSAKRLCKDRDSPKNSNQDVPSAMVNVKMRERNSPRKSKNSARYSGLHHSPMTDISRRDNPVTVCQSSRLTWHGKDGHSTLIKIDWPSENSVSNLTSSTLNSTPVTPLYDQLDSDPESENRHTIRITRHCGSCATEKCLECELKATGYESPRAEFKVGQPVTATPTTEHVNLHDSLEPSPLNSADISYQNLNRLSAISTSSNSEQHSDRKMDAKEPIADRRSVMTSSHDSSSSYSNPSKRDELYECYNFTRPNYINLSSSSKSSPSSPLKSPLKSTISITFRSPTKSKPDYELIENVDTPTNERDSVYEDIDLDKNLSIVEEASIPETDASLPTQQACQPAGFDQDLIILETPTGQTSFENDADVYSQVKFFRKSIDEVNAMLLGSPEKESSRHYENVAFPSTGTHDYENINVDALKICDKDDKMFDASVSEAAIDNGNTVKGKTQKNLNVRELANRFESPTEPKGPFTFDKFKAEIKYPSLERKDDEKVELRQEKAVSPKSYRLSKNSGNARSLDENAFTEEFRRDDKRQSLEANTKKRDKFQPDLNLNLEENSKVEPEIITPTTENKISLVQRFEKPDLKQIIGFETEKRLSRERIEKYKEERRNFLREKYSSQSFRSNPENLTRIKIKKEKEDELSDAKEDTPKFERRNTVDLGQRMRFSVAKSANHFDAIQSPDGAKSIDFSEGSSGYSSDVRPSKDCERTEKVSPSYNIRNMAAMFEQKSQNNGSG